MKGSFSQRVWELATSIPAGRVTTYGIIARAAGAGPMAARSITAILGKAPNQAAIPYHRIVYTNGKIWLPSGAEEKRLNLYRKEEIDVNDKGFILNFSQLLYYFDE